ncbi:MAG TPA: class F sortase, partial [Euzebyales bacterium]|nr:class F sortase [Euzebyales bacterium]
MGTARRRIVLALLTALSVAGCAGVKEAPGRAYGALVDHFNEYAEEERPATEQVPAEVRRTKRPAARTAVPVRIVIPAIDVRSNLDRVDLQPNGAIAPPEEWETAAWYRRGARPGQRGPAVILGHVDSVNGPAVFHRLNELEVGDVIRIVRKDGSTVRFAVQRSARFPKTRFPTGDVYLPTREPTLRLITCGGRFDPEARSYRQN